jgi:dTDP-4-amino-4,6-dideoxygalactose transaminase
METTNVATQGKGTAARVPLLDLKAQFATIREEVMRAVEGVLESQHFILGKEVELLEKEVAAFVGAPYAVGCASGSDALYLALRAEEIGPGDEVITTAFTFGATAGAIARTGATPVFIDIQQDTFNIDPALIEVAITNRTRAIMPVHLFGLAADLQPILTIAGAHALAVVEDAAQAIGATYRARKLGSCGEFGCFSFFPSKNLGCAGDGGLVTTCDAARAERLRLLRAHGSGRKYHYEILGVNSRLDALQAAILRVKLGHLVEWEQARQEHAALYVQLFENYRLSEFVQPPVTPMSCSHVFNQFVIRCADRDLLRGYLAERGIATEIYYPEPLHLQPAFAYLGYQAGVLPRSEAACKETLALPIYPELREEDQERIVNSIVDFYYSRT